MGVRSVRNAERLRRKDELHAALAQGIERFGDLRPFTAVLRFLGAEASRAEVEAFGIEMTNSSSELLDYFVKQKGKK